MPGQDHLITLARAYSDCALLSTSVAALREMDDSGGKALIGEVIALYGLATLEAHRAWYLETGYFEPPKSERCAGRSTSGAGGWGRARWRWSMRSGFRRSCCRRRLLGAQRLGGRG